MTSLKLKILKKQVLKNNICYAIILIILASIYFLLTTKHMQATETNANLISEIQAKQTIINVTKDRIAQSNLAQKFWTESKQIDKIRTGLDIDLLKTIIDYLHNRLHLAYKVDINLSTPVDLTGNYITQTMVVSASEVRLQLIGISDQQLLMFTDALEKNVPGFIKWQSMQINKNFEFSDHIISQILNGEVPDLVTMELTFLWQDLKELNNVK